MELWFPHVPITMPSTLCVSLRALPPSPFTALNDALRRFMSLANNLPVTDRVLAWGGERPLIDAAIPPLMPRYERLFTDHFVTPLC